MKIDKEALMKHRFWVVLGGFVLLWVIALMVLLFGSSGPIQAKKKEYETAQKSLSRHANPKQSGPPESNPFLKPWVGYGERFRKHKDEVWHQAWQLQKDMITWPSSKKAPLQAIWDRADSFKEWLADFSKEPESTLARNDYKDTLYIEQFLDLDKIVEPIQFKGGKQGFDGIMTPETGTATGTGADGQRGQARPAPVYGGEGGTGAGGRSIRSFWQNTPTTEECWLAQEDFWVKHEMLKALRATLDRVGRFERLPLKKGEALPEGIVARYHFRNPSWELDLLVERGPDGRNFISSKSTIKNVHVSRRPLYLANPRTKEGVGFRLIQGDLDYLLRVKGEPLPWNQSTDFKDQSRVDTINPEKPFDVVQVFDWDTSPIRRIDELRTGFHSHRTANVTLVASKKFITTQQGGGDPALGQQGYDPSMGVSPDPSMQPSFDPGMSMSPEGGQGVDGQGQAAAGASPVTELNSLLRNRYLYVTDQCRHLPVAMSLVVEQGHIHNLLTEVVNSPLRIQVTQVQVQHATGVEAPTAPGEAEGGVDGGVTVSPRFPTRRQPVTTTGRTGQGAMPGGNPSSLVHLNVYGIAALYEKFPTKPATTTAEGGVTVGQP